MYKMYVKVNISLVLKELLKLYRSHNHQSRKLSSPTFECMLEQASSCLLETNCSRR